MNKIKNISASLLILVGLIFIVNGTKCFMTIDKSILLYIVRFWIVGIIFIGFGILIKDFIKI